MIDIGLENYNELFFSSISPVKISYISKILTFFFIYNLSLFLSLFILTKFEILKYLNLLINYRQPDFNFHYVLISDFYILNKNV